MTTKRFFAGALALMLAVSTPIFFSSCEKENNNGTEKPDNNNNDNGDNNQEEPNEMNLGDITYPLTLATSNYAGSGENTTLCVKLFNEDTSVCAMIFFHGTTMPTGSYAITENFLDIHQGNYCIISIQSADHPNTPRSGAAGELVTIEATDTPDNYILSTDAWCTDGTQMKFHYKGYVRKL